MAAIVPVEHAAATETPIASADALSLLRHQTNGIEIGRVYTPRHVSCSYS